MGAGGWRRAFCTSVRRDTDAAAAGTRVEAGEKHQRSPRSCAKLSFFAGGGSNPSTPRLALAEAAPGLRCRTKSKTPDSKTLQCDAATSSVPTATTPRSRSPALFHRQALSAPSSPRTASRFALFKHLSRSRCRICSLSLKASQETPIFTAECSHAFHFSCITAHVRSHASLACPVCSASWRHAPFLSALRRREDDEPAVEPGAAGEMENRNPNRRTTNGGSRNTSKGGERQLGENRVAAAASAAVAAKVYDDDEPLLIVSRRNQGGGMRFNPIPEAANEDKDEEDGEDEETEAVEREDEFYGLLATPRAGSAGCTDGGVRRPTPMSRAGGVLVSVMPQAALLSEGRRHRSYVVALKVKAPPIGSFAPLRAPIDLVTVLDVSQGMTGEKLRMLKRAMRLVVSSLGPGDRLSIVAFSAAAGAKRLLPLRRMSRQGQRAARQIVERLVVVGGGAAARGASVGDALRKATKVLEDRRERNPVATIMLLSDSRQQQQQQQPEQEKKESNHHDYKPLRSPRGTGGGHIGLHPLATTTAATRFAHLEIPIKDAGLGDGGAERSPQKQGQVPSEDEFIKCVGGLVSVVMQDVRLQLVFPSGEFSAVHPCGGGGGGCDVALRGGTSVIRLGDLYADEERELLVELRLPVAPPGGQGRHHRLSVKCNYKDPATQDLAFSAEQNLLLPPLQHQSELGRSASSSACPTTSVRLRNIFVSTRAVAESRRLADLSDYATARHLLSSARALILQSASDGRQDHHLVQNLDAELAALQRRRYQAQHRLHHDQLQEEVLSPSGMRRRRREAPAEVRGEPLTPTSAWRAAEQLAKVASMRKTLNRAGDLHGFENARF
ncbi:zinc finger family protein [Musa troglodytarum]|uniref:Zinc finger family protein n=1 Tax=Musa troglodytarum TaxID=320322 RepID=A0A9E7FK36_9LILI|nr:zinc finger family protein [Musa troglodytarum]